MFTLSSVLTLAYISILIVPWPTLVFTLKSLKNDVQDGSNSFENRSRIRYGVQMPKKIAEDAPRELQDGSKTPPRRPRTPPGRLQEASRTAPRRPQTASKSSPLLISLSRPQNDLKKRPKRPPRHVQNASKTRATQRRDPCTMIWLGDGTTSQ